MKKYTMFTGVLLSTLLVLGANPGQSLSASKTAAKQRPYEDVISKLARKNNIPADLVHAVVRTESNYNARARGSVGEIGLMQLRLSTARSLGYSGSASGLYDPRINLEYGTKYLGIAHKLSAGSTCGTILKYNAGHGAKRMNPISARYCQKVKAYMAAVK